MSKKRHRSISGLDDNSRDTKRVKTDLEADQNAVIENPSAKKKKKHSRQVVADETSTLECDRTVLELANVSELLNNESRLCSPTGTDVEGTKRIKKHKRHRHHEDTSLAEMSEVTVKQEIIDNLTVANNCSSTQVDDVEEQSSPKKKKKKKKKHQTHIDDDCVINFDVSVKQEFVDLANDEDTAPMLVNSVSELSPSKASEHKKKKKKRHQQDDLDDNPCFLPVEKSVDRTASTTASHHMSSATSHRLANTSHLPSVSEKTISSHRPTQLHSATYDLRYKPGEGYKEIRPTDHKDTLWWEDIATDPNLELWLVRAPADFSSSILSDTRGALYDSVLVPQPDRPGEGFQVSIQGVQQSKLVVLLPSKQDKKFHVASDINGYVTVTRTEAFKLDVEQPSPNISRVAELRTDVEPNKKHKKHKSKEKDAEREESRRKHAGSRHSTA